MAWKVMQRLETGEVVCAKDRLPTEDAAFEWIESNQDNYPESTFFVEEEEAVGRNFWLGALTVTIISLSDLEWFALFGVLA